MNGVERLTLANVIYDALQESRIVARPNLASPLPKDRGRGWEHCLTVCRLVAHSVSVAPSLKNIRVLVNEVAGPPCVHVLPCRAHRVSRRSFVRDVGGLDLLAVPVGLKFNHECIQWKKKIDKRRMEISTRMGCIQAMTETYLNTRGI